MSLEGSKKCDVIILSADFGSGHHQVSLALEKVLRSAVPFGRLEYLITFNT